MRQDLGKCCQEDPRLGVHAFPFPHHSEAVWQGRGSVTPKFEAFALFVRVCFPFWKMRVSTPTKYNIQPSTWLTVDTWEIRVFSSLHKGRCKSWKKKNLEPDIFLLPSSEGRWDPDISLHWNNCTLPWPCRVCSPMALLVQEVQPLWHRANGDTGSSPCDGLGSWPFVCIREDKGEHFERKEKEDSHRKTKQRSWQKKEWGLWHQRKQRSIS